MNNITISSVTGQYPFSIYVCDIYSKNCVLVDTVNTTIPPSVTINIPVLFQTANNFIIKIIDANDCQTIKIINCLPTSTPTSTPTETPTPTPTPTPTQTPNCNNYLFCGTSSYPLAQYRYTSCQQDLVEEFFGEKCQTRCVDTNYEIKLISGVGSCSLLGKTEC